MKLYEERNEEVRDDTPEREGTPIVPEKHTYSFSWGGEGD
jgi:hypothetical protein